MNRAHILSASPPRPMAEAPENVASPHAFSGSLSPAFLRAQAVACGRLANIALKDRDLAEAGRLIERARAFALAALAAEGSA